MAEGIFFGDIVEENGKTIRENNLEREHEIAIGTLIELPSGERLFVCQHARDCDGTPLYGLCMEKDLHKDFENFHTRVYSSWAGLWGSESLKIVQ